MWDLAVREDDYAAVDSILSRYSEAPLSYRIVPAYARGDSAGKARHTEEARVLDARQSQIAARYVATFLEDARAAEELARLDLQPRRNAAIRLGAQTLLAWLDVARGRWAGAKASFDIAERMDGGSGARLERALAATLPFLAVPRADLDAARRDLLSWNASDPMPGSAGLAAVLRPHYRLYLLGLLSSKLGEADRATAYAAEIDRLPAPAGAEGVVASLAATVRADVAWRRGDPARTLEVLSSVDGAVPLELVYVKPFVNVREYTQEHARYLRAQALMAVGRPEDARGWFENSFQGSPAELAYLAPMHAALGRLDEQRGALADAALHLQKFVALWSSAEAALQPRVDTARAALRRLAPPTPSR